MSKLMDAVRTYPLVATTLLVGVVGLLLLATPWAAAAPWIVGVYALAIAAWEAVGMVRQLLQGNAGLDILAVTAITAAVLVGEPWAALVVVLMLTGGEALEDYAENRSQRELTALLRRSPQTATRLVDARVGAGAPAATDDADDAADARTEDVPVEDVEVGDLLLVRPGAQVPVDAELVSEAAEFDESSLTGESLPVERVTGERIASGAINGQRAVTMRAIALAADSEYQQIVRLVEEASASKASVVRLADRYALPFTVVSLAIAGIAWVLSGDPVRFAEVLVVATPCPLLIAAPVAFLGGMSRSARFGLIVKGGGTLEQLSRARSVALDKTGTVTTGEPTLERLLPTADVTDDRLLGLAASAEVYSSHVLARSVVAAARRRQLPLREALEAEEVATNGVQALIAERDGEDARMIRVGKLAWIRSFADAPEQVPVSSGELGIHVAAGDRYLGAIIMRDQVRPDAPEAMDGLRELGIQRMLMVTGDVAETAEPIAEQLGIEEVHSQCRPADKVQIVRDVQPRPLIMVGDGLNDAPVLASADIGFAMGARGATAASESADVVNRFDHLGSLPKAVQIGQDTVRIALQAIWAGILISVGLMLVAAAGFLPAIVGAWMQELVDLVAILWALRALGPRSERQG